MRLLGVEWKDLTPKRLNCCFICSSAISELDERAVAREKRRADAAEQKAQEQTMRGNREEKRANEAESRLSDIERFIRLSGASEAYEHWNFLHDGCK